MESLLKLFKPLPPLFIMESIQEVFEEMGLTSSEAKIYLLLLKLGSVRVGKIIKLSHLQSSTVHNSLNSLIDKGYVNYVLKGKIRYYSAVPPEIIPRILKQKEENLLSILPELERIHYKEMEKPHVEVYEGIKGLRTMLEELISDARKGDNYYFFAVDQKRLNKEIQEFFRLYDLRRESKGLNVMGIARRGMEKLFKSRTYLKVRYAPFPVLSNVSLCKNKIAFIVWDKTPYGILVYSKVLFSSYVKLFKTIYSSLPPNI